MASPFAHVATGILLFVLLMVLAYIVWASIYSQQRADAMVWDELAKQAHQEGIEAFGKGKPIMANPYDESRLHKSWESGWLAGESWQADAEWSWRQHEQ